MKQRKQKIDACPDPFCGRMRIGRAWGLWVLFLLALPVESQAQYDYTIDNGTVTITKYTGAGGAVVIPSNIVGKTVTSIGDWAFVSCTSLTSVTIPNSVTNVGNYPFFNCTNLATIIVVSNNPVYSNLAGVLFNKDQTTLIRCPEGKTGSYAIPDSVTDIDDFAFSGCARLCGVIIPYGIAAIGDYALSSCTSVTNVTVGSGVTNIAYNAFPDCTNLTAIIVVASNSVYSSLDGVLFNKSTNKLIKCPGGKAGSYTIPGAVTIIGEWAFYYCTRLTCITIPGGVTYIGDSTFSDCASLTNVVIGNAVTNIGDWAFSSCPSLAGIYFWGNAPGLGGPYVFDGIDNAIIYYVSGNTGWPPVPDAWPDALNGRPTALWTPPSYTVTFESQGGTPAIPATKVVTNGLAYGTLATPTRTGFTFGGWWTGTGGTGTEVTSITTVSLLAAQTLYAKWMAVSLAVSPSSTNVQATASSGLQIAVTANVPWTAATNQPWLKITSGFSGATNGTVTYSVTNNSGTLARTGAVIIAGGGIFRTCTVIQAGGSLVISPSSMNVSPTVSSGLQIAVTANVPWTAATNQPWLKITSGFSGSTNGTVAYSVTNNSGTSARTGAIIIAGGGIYRTCTVVQVAASLAISPGSTNVSSSAAGGLSIGVAANVSWTAVSNAAWIAITGGAAGTNNGTITLSVAPNAGTSARTGAVIVAGGGITRTCTVRQAGVAVQRIIGLSGNLAFGNVVTGRTVTSTMAITNSGNSTLTVTSIGYPGGFSGAWSGSIAVGNSTNVTVTFAPVAVTTYSGTITVNSDKTSGENTISVSGAGTVWRPEAQDDASFGMISNRFGFNINWASGRVVVVDACTNLTTTNWIQIGTNTLTAGSSYFCDPQWSNYIGRFYRIRSLP